MADKDGPSIMGLIIWKALNVLPRGSREPEHKSSYRPRLVQDVARTSREKIKYCELEPEIRHLTRRKRRLSIISSLGDNDVTLSPSSHQQSASPFFKLPIELRLKIYEEVLGDNIFHILRRKEKLGHRLCKGNGNPEQCISNNCRGFKLPSGFHAGTGNGGLIQLLQSCRQIYSEAVEVLYTKNLFNFDSLESFISFSCEILPHRLDSVHKIQLDFRFNLSVLYSECTPRSNWPRWERTWRIIASMLALEEVRMRFSWPEMSKTDREELRILKPLQLAEGLKLFEVTMPFLRNTNLLDRVDMPFRLTNKDKQELEI